MQIFIDFYFYLNQSTTRTKPNYFNFILKKLRDQKKPSNFFQMRQLRNAPPSNIVKNKSDKVNFGLMLPFRLFFYPISLLHYKPYC